MAELLVSIVDTVSPDFYLNTALLKAGMVITVQEDGWLWGKQEVANAAWRIIKVPGVPAAQFGNLLGPEPVNDVGSSPKTRQPRAFKISFPTAILAAALGPTFLTDASQVAPNAVGHPIATLPQLTAAQVGPTVRKHCAIAVAQTAIVAATIVVPPIADPAVIGMPTHILG